MFKVIFRNQIGKLLYDGMIDAKQSKSREVQEKAFKNQLKIAVLNKKDSKWSVQYCKINFSRKDDMHEFDKVFRLAIEKKTPEASDVKEAKDKPEKI